MAIERTCVGCRSKDSTSQLLRFVVLGQRVVADPSRSAIGRGAYLHPTKECISQAVSRKAFARALRANVQAPTVESLTSTSD